MLELRGLSKSYAGLRVVGPLDLDIPPARTTVLIGPSGSGKSTLLRVMIGLVRPDQGEVRFEGTPLSDATVLRMRWRMGYVIQEGGLFPHLTAAGNASLMARYLGWTSGRIRDRLTALADLTQYPPNALGRYPAQLSGGQRQRVSLMRALMLDPDVLLLDEPLGSLDPMIRSDLQSDLRRIFRRLGKTVVLVTHDLAEAAYLGDEIVLMREGKILQIGTLEDFLQRPVDAFVTRFVRAQRLSLDIGGEDAS